MAQTVQAVRNTENFAINIISVARNISNIAHGF